jgi:undecaprenyl-diphosphatase
MSHLTYAEAVVVGLLQGVTELFPVSSLGHSVLIPALAGGSWAADLNVSKPESPYLAFIVGLHVATALALIAYFWRDWVRITRGFLTSLRDRRVAAPEQRLAWMIVLATIPVGVSGLLLEHLFRVVFSKPVPTALFLTLNGLVLLAGERRRRFIASPATAQAPMAYATAREHDDEQPLAVTREQPPASAPGRPLPGGGPVSEDGDPAVAADRRLAAMRYSQAVLIGAVQVFALLPGISRDGIVSVTGMFRGLSREDAVRYSFLLSAPVILAAGLLKLPDLFGPLGAGIHGQVLVGSVVSFLGAYVSVRFLVRYFAKARSLTPFGIYCLAAGLGSLIWLIIR